MSFPTKPTFPTWATNGGTRVAPSAGQKATGWVVNDIPPAETFNWIDGQQGDSLEWLDEVKVLAAERTYYVDPDNGDDATGNGWGLPYLTIQGALNGIKAARGGGSAGENGTPGEWWAVSVAPGEYEECITVYGWIVVQAQQRRTVRITGPTLGAAQAVVTLQGGANTHAPCALVGCDVSRDDTAMAGQWAVLATQFAGDGGGDLTTENAAVLRDCYIQTSPLSSVLAPVARLRGILAQGNSGSTTGQAGALLYVTDCDLEIGPPANPTTNEIAIRHGAVGYIVNSTSAWPEAQVSLLDAGWARDTAVLPSAPICLLLSNITGGALLLDTEQTDAWLSNRDAALGSPTPTPYGQVATFQNVQIAGIHALNNSLGSATDVALFAVARGDVRVQPQIFPTTVSNAIKADGLLLELNGTFSGEESLAAYLDPFNGRNGAPFDGTNFQNLTNSATVALARDVMSKDTSSYARTALITIGSGAVGTEALIAFRLGSDFSSDGSQDFRPIQAALDLAGADPAGGIVQLGPGTFDLGEGALSSTAILDVPQNVTLRGHGMGATVLNMQDTIGVNSLNGIVLAAGAALEDVTLTGDAYNRAVYINGADARVERVTSFVTLQLSGVSAPLPTQIHVNGAGAVIRDVTIGDGTNTVTGSSGIVIDGANATIDNVTIEKTRFQAIVVDNFGCKLSNVTVIDCNNVSPPSSDYDVDVLSGGDGCKIAGLTVRLSTTTGGALRLESCDRCQLTNIELQGLANGLTINAGERNEITNLITTDFVTCVAFTGAAIGNSLSDVICEVVDVGAAPNQYINIGSSSLENKLTNIQCGPCAGTTPAIGIVLAGNRNALSNVHVDDATTGISVTGNNNCLTNVFCHVDDADAATPPMTTGIEVTGNKNLLTAIRTRNIGGTAMKLSSTAAGNQVIGLNDRANSAASGHWFYSVHLTNTASYNVIQGCVLDRNGDNNDTAIQADATTDGNLITGNRIFNLTNPADWYVSNTVAAINYVIGNVGVPGTANYGNDTNATNY